ncbi:MAG: class I SAM-dependent methyltransferase [Bacteroidota bacterium]
MHIPKPAIFSGQRATNYDDFILTYVPFYRSILASLPALINQHIPVNNAPILVAGCGTGNELMKLSTTKPEWLLEGIDPSPEMVAQAREKLTGRANVRLINGYVADLPSEAYYGAATLLLVLHFIPDDGGKLALLRDLSTRMLPGAPLVLLDIFGSTAELADNLETLWAMMPSTPNPDAVAERLRTLPERIQYISEQRLNDLLLEAGFDPPRRFFQAAIYGGWITKRKYE